jgi:SAV_6107-like HEPN
MWSQAALEPRAPERYRQAHVAALRGAAAVLGGRRHTGRGRPMSAWLLLDDVAPELADWSAYFRDSAVRRAAIEAGSAAAVTDRDADDLVLAVGEFLAEAARQTGLPGSAYDGSNVGQLPLRLAG